MTKPIQVNGADKDDKTDKTKKGRLLQVQAIQRKLVQLHQRLSGLGYSLEYTVKQTGTSLPLPPPPPAPEPGPAPDPDEPSASA